MNKKDYMYIEERGKNLVKPPGSIRGRDFVIDGCEECEIGIFCNSSQVLVDYCTDCKIFIGPVSGPVFVRNAKNCVVVVTCAQQLRTRECEDCVFILALPGYPIIESSSHLSFGGFVDQTPYKAFKGQVAATGMEIKVDAYKEVFDFSKDGPPAGEHWKLLSEAETSEVIRNFDFKQMLPDDERVDDISIIADLAVEAAIRGEDVAMSAAEQLLRNEEPEQMEISDPADLEIYMNVWKLLHGNILDADFDEQKVHALSEIVRTQIPGISEAREFVEFLNSDFRVRHGESDLLELLAAGEASGARFSGFLEKPETPYFAIYLLLRRNFQAFRRFPITADLAAFAMCVSDRETVISNFLRLQTDETEGERLVQQCAAWAQGDKVAVSEIASWMATAKPDCLLVIQGALEIDGISDYPAYELHGISDLVRLRPIVGVKPLFTLVARILEATAEAVEREGQDPETLPNVVVIDLNSLVPIFVNAHYQVEIENLDFRISAGPVEHGNFTSVLVHLEISHMRFALEVHDGTSTIDAKVVLARGATTGRVAVYDLTQSPFSLRAPADWRLTAVKETRTSLEFSFTSRDPQMIGNFKEGQFSISGNPFAMYLHKDPRVPEIADRDFSFQKISGGLLRREIMIFKKARGDEISFVNWNILADSLTDELKQQPLFPHGNQGSNASVTEQGSSWKQRKSQILSEILSLSPDILTLQEVDHFSDFLEPALKQQGLAGLWQPKKAAPGIFQGGYSDGVALFWKSEIFRLVSSESAYVELEKFPYILAVLEHMRSRKKFIAISVHLKAGNDADSRTRRLKQMSRLLAIIERKRNEIEPSGLFVAGDLNAEEGELDLGLFGNAHSQVEGMTTRKLRNGNLIQRKSDFILFDGTVDLMSALKLPDESIVWPTPEYPSDHFAMQASFSVRSETLPEVRSSRISDSVPPPPPPPVIAPASTSSVKVFRLEDVQTPPDSGAILTLVLSGASHDQADDVAEGLRHSLDPALPVRIILADASGPGARELAALVAADIFVWTPVGATHERWAQLGWMTGRRPDTVLLFEPTGTSDTLLEIANDNTFTGRLIRESNVRMAAGDFRSLGTTLATRIMAVSLEKRELETPWSDYFSRVIGEFGF